MSMNISFGDLNLVQTPTDVTYKIISAHPNEFEAYMDFLIESNAFGSFRDLEQHALTIRQYRKKYPQEIWEAV